MSNNTDRPESQSRERVFRARRQLLASLAHLPIYSRGMLAAVLSPLSIWTVVVGNAILQLGVLIFWRFEHGPNPAVNSYLDALWWGLSTITTVGYGDIVPITLPGRLISMALMVTGVVFFVGWTALVMSQLMLETAREIKESERMSIIEFDTMIQSIKELHDRLDRIEASLPPAARRRGPKRRRSVRSGD